jgi:hypothetical protein
MTDADFSKGVNFTFPQAINCSFGEVFEYKQDLRNWHIYLQSGTLN